MQKPSLVVAVFAGAMALGVGLASTVSLEAQAGQYRVQFTASPDHNGSEHGLPIVERYELLVTAPGATSAMAPINLAKPAPSGGEITVNVQAQLGALPASPSCNLSAPSPATCYMAVVRAVGAGGVGASTGRPFPLNPRAPGAPGAADISRQ